MLLPERLRYTRPLFYCVHLFYRLVLWCTFVRISYKGLENVPHEPVIFAANHQSSLDIPLVGALTGSTPHIWLATSELMRSFLLRWIVPRLSVLVDITTPMSAMRCLLKVIKMVQGSDRHLMIFPEGGRFEDGQIHEFFGGFVILAKKTGRPIVPVCLIGVNRVYPPQTFLVQNHPITVVVGPRFMLGEHESEEVFKNRVQAWFEETIKGE